MVAGAGQQPGLRRFRHIRTARVRQGAPGFSSGCGEEKFDRCRLTHRDIQSAEATRGKGPAGQKQGQTSSTARREGGWALRGSRQSATGGRVATSCRTFPGHQASCLGRCGPWQPLLRPASAGRTAVDMRLHCHQAAEAYGKACRPRPLGPAKPMSLTGLAVNRPTWARLAREAPGRGRSNWTRHPLKDT